MNIDDLPKTTISGRRFTRKQLTLVQETAEICKNLSRKELALTVCENLNWTNPAGKLKVNSCLILLEKLESFGILTLPVLKKAKRAKPTLPTFKIQPDTTPITETLEALGPISLQPILTKEDRADFKAFLEAYHYLKYKHPFGSYLSYFVVSDATQTKLGCLLFTASAALTLAPRDKWIGWEKKQREKLLHLIVSNNRFLIFPWVKVPNLASHALSLATKRIGDDWVKVYKYRPVLLETFVDTTQFTGTCYRAANWTYLGQTQGRGRFDPKNEKKQTKKDIFMYPLEENWKHCLTHLHRKTSLKKKYRNDVQSSHTRCVDDAFILMWEKVAKMIHEVAEQYDAIWRVRKRVINSMLLILLIFRLVFSKNSQSYGTTIDELWDSCRRLDIPLTQESAIAPSSFCAARKKMDEAIFKEINRRMIETNSEKSYAADYLWLGHRVFAVDGSKLNLPKELINEGYQLTSDKAYYPQGLMSCLYQLKAQIPFDFDLASNMNERTCALNHLQALKQDDVVVYDRGYFSYYMLHKHLETKIHAVFRLARKSSNVIDDFFTGNDTDILAHIYPSRPTRGKIQKAHPEITITPLTIRLIKYQIDGNIYCLGTTLTDQERYPNIQDFKAIYYERWGVEELYKVSKRVFQIEDFHAKSERGVKQEIFAHFALITMNRYFANQADNHHNHMDYPDKDPALIGNHGPKQNGKIKTNFKNCIQVIARGMEEILFIHEKLNDVVQRIFSSVVSRYQKERTDRSYPRKSMRPRSKWRPNYKKLDKTLPQAISTTQA